MAKGQKALTHRQTEQASMNSQMGLAQLWAQGDFVTRAVAIAVSYTPFTLPTKNEG